LCIILWQRLRCIFVPCFLPFEFLAAPRCFLRDFVPLLVIFSPLFYGRFSRPPSSHSPEPTAGMFLFFGVYLCEFSFHLTFFFFPRASSLYRLDRIGLCPPFVAWSSWRIAEISTSPLSFAFVARPCGAMESFFTVFPISPFSDEPLLSTLRLVASWP